MKKILSVILAVLMCLSMMTYVFADDGSGKKDVGEHEHQLMDMANAACHYSECTICFELFNVGDHTFVDGKCSVCGHLFYGNPAEEDIKGEGKHEHIIMKSADEETHFEECLVCHERFGVGKHSFENGKCYVCGYDGSGKKDVGEHKHELMDMANAACHYSECTICFELFNVGAHTFVDGKCSVCGHTELVNPFIDVKDNAWYRNDIVAAVKLGIINGKSETIFAPDDNLTYAEAVKLAACMNQRFVEGKVTLTNGTPWYQPYVDYCKKNGIITKDYEYSKFATRAGYMEIFANALTDEALKEINDITDGAIPDVQMTDSFAPAVYKLYRAGILQGVDANFSCNPRANIKRGEVAVILLRMMDEDKRLQFEIPGFTSDKEESKNENETFEEDDDDDEVIDEPGKDNQKTESSDDTVYVEPETPKDKYKIPTQTVTPGHEIVPAKPFDGGSQEYIQDTPLTIHKQPEGSEAEEYGTKYELEVQVYGGKTPYKYQWYYYTGSRNDTAKIENGDFAKDVTSEALILSIEKDNALLGKKIYCEITDAEGTKVNTDTVKVYGPFSMPVDDWTLESGKNTLIGRVADGILKKGEKVSVIRDGKVIAIGVAEDLQMFNKSMDETIKGDNVGIVFKKDEGATPSSGDIVVKYQPTHVVDTSDIIN